MRREVTEVKLCLKFAKRNMHMPLKQATKIDFFDMLFDHSKW